MDAIRHGFSHWWSAPASFQARSLTAGSLRGPDAVLTAAFHEQGYEIGWLHFGLGRISTKWADAARQYNALPLQPEADLHWASILIAALWPFSKSLWTFRNEVVHGATIEEQAQRRITELHNKITAYYRAFQSNEHLVLQRHQYLFTTRTKEERLSSSYDNMSAWIRSVEEALHVVQQHIEAVKDVSRPFFPSSDHNGNYPTDSDSSYILSSMASTAETSITSAEATTSTTMSSAALSASVFTCIYYDSDSLSYGSDDSSLDTGQYTTNHNDILAEDSESPTTIPSTMASTASSVSVLNHIYYDDVFMSSSSQASGLNTGQYSATSNTSSVEVLSSTSAASSYLIPMEDTMTFQSSGLSNAPSNCWNYP